MNETKEIIKYDEQFCIVIPKYYEFENRPSWVVAYRGNFGECKNVFGNCPDLLTATFEENANNRHMKRQEYLFLLSIGKKKEADKIKKQYHL